MPAPVSTTIRRLPLTSRRRARVDRRSRRVTRRRGARQRRPLVTDAAAITGVPPPGAPTPTGGSLRAWPCRRSGRCVPATSPWCGRRPSSPTWVRGCRRSPSDSSSRPAPTIRCGPASWPPPPSSPWASWPRSAGRWPTASTAGAGSSSPPWPRPRFAAVLAVLAATGHAPPGVLVGGGLPRRGGRRRRLPHLSGHAARPRPPRRPAGRRVAVVGPVQPGPGDRPRPGRRRPGGRLRRLGLRRQRRVLRRRRRGPRSSSASPPRRRRPSRSRASAAASSPGPGWRRPRPGCRSAILLIAIVALIGSPFIGLVPAVAIDGLHRGAGRHLGPRDRPGHRRRRRRSGPGAPGARPGDGAGSSSVPSSPSPPPSSSTASPRPW